MAASLISDQSELTCTFGVGYSRTHRPCRGLKNRLWITTTEGLDHTNRWLLCGPFTLNECTKKKGCSIYFITIFIWELLLNFTNNDKDTASKTLKEVWEFEVERLKWSFLVAHTPKISMFSLWNITVYIFWTVQHEDLNGKDETSYDMNAPHGCNCSLGSLLSPRILIVSFQLWFFLKHSLSQRLLYAI